MFDWLWDKFKVSSKNPNVEIKRKYINKGVKFSVYKSLNGEREKLTFPIIYSKNFDLNSLVKKDFYLSLQALEDLWHSGQLELTEEDNYFIDNESIYEYKEELIEFLGFESDQEVELEIKSEMPVGSKKFSLAYDLYHPNYGYISNFYNRYGCFFPINEEEAILLSSDLVELLEMLENPPEVREEQFKYLAKVKSKAKALDAKLSRYLEKEEYYFPEKLDVEIEEERIDNLKLSPIFNDLDNNLNQEAKNTLLKDNKYGSKKEKGKNRRIFFDEQIKNDYQKIQENRDIKGSNVPKFINNPGAFLPDTVDLNKFSERVKGLKEYVYKAQPYVHNKDSDDMDWLELETGVSIIPEMETSELEDKDLEISEFEELVAEAKEKGEEYVLWDDKWVKIPENSEEFIAANHKAEELIGDEKVDKKKLPYIFDIYDNIDRLDYSLDLLKHKEKLKAAGALKYEPPKLFNGELYPYQKQGYIWLNRLDLASLGGLLADDMGLGKTVQTIAMMAKLKAENKLKPSLIVAPASLLENWKAEIKKFCPEIKDIYIHRGDRIKNPKIIKKSEVVLTTYQTLLRDQILLGEINWQFMICDEVQNIKNQSTMVSHAVKAQKASLRLGLSGTPIQNDLSDLWSIVDYIQPGLLDSYKSFKEEFMKPIKNSTDSNELEEYEKELKRKIKPVYLRRTKEGELSESLPDKKEEIYKINMSKIQKKYYKNLILREKNSDKNTYISTLQNLIQICSHPRLYTKDWEKTDLNKLIKEGPKLKKVLELLAEIKSAGEKALIFTTYRNMQYIIQRVIRFKFALDDIPIINGQSKKRLRTVEKFNKQPGFRCMILSPKAAGTGLNITGANHVVHYTRWWNPAVEQQATDRAYRIGQNKDVYVYYPIITGNTETVEEKLARLLTKKKKLAKNIIVPNKKLEKEIKDELVSLTQFYEE